MSASLAIATTPLAMMIEDRIRPYQLPFEFSGAWDELAANPMMVMRLPDVCELVAYHLHSVLKSPEGHEDLRGLKTVYISTGSRWHVHFSKWSLDVQVPADASFHFDIADLHTLLQAEI